MRILWLATSPSLYREEKVMGWIGALENIVRNLCPQISLGIAFEYQEDTFKVEKTGVTYYPISLSKAFVDIIKMKFNGNDNWYQKKPCLINVINDFRPDLIHCFGSEWNWGLIAKETSIPLVIHMQGFINIYNDASAKVNKKKKSLLYDLFNPRTVFQRKFLKYYDKRRNDTELEIMRSCHYFMGRTEWDKSIVKYFSQGSKYFYCAEAIRPFIYDCSQKWSYKKSEVIRIVTIASAGNLKGNGIILETAKILKQMGVEIEWRVSGNKDIFADFEFSTGIAAADVGVKLLGFIDAEQVVDELLNAEMYVLPSIMDNSPNSLCEAQLIGTPVIASYVGGLPQMVENGETGILYPYNEPYALAFKIMDLHNSPERQIYLSENERLKARDRHNPELLACRLENIYSTIIAYSKK